MISQARLSTKVLIVGASGMLGRELVSACRRRGMPFATRGGSASLDITCAPDVRRVLHEVRPSIVINAAGYTDVDRAECEFEQALLVNGDGPGNLARQCLEIDALLVHLSSDYVFGGGETKPYRTDHPTDPMSSYGLSKLAGEKAVISSGCPFLILRSSWLFATHGRNFVSRVLQLARERDRLEVVDDQRGRPTSCRDLAEMTFDLLEWAQFSLRSAGMGRIFHVANRGQATWYDLARRIVWAAGLRCDVQPCTSESRLLHAPRPAYSVLDLSETIGIIGRPRHWREALRECLRAQGALRDRNIDRLGSTTLQPASEETK